MKYQFIEKNRSEFTVKKMCQMFKISVSGYQHWKTKEISDQQIRRERLKKRILELYFEHKRMAGSPMITADLRDDPEFFNVSKNTVARSMQEMNLRSQTVKKFVVTTDSRHNEPVAPNRLNRKFDIKNRVFFNMNFDFFINSLFLNTIIPIERLL